MELVESKFDLAEVKLTYSPDFNIFQLPQLKCSRDCIEYLFHIHNYSTEELSYSILLNRAGKMLGIVPYTGTKYPAIADILLKALISNVSSLILGSYRHNGRPNDEDYRYTKSFKLASTFFDIKLSDSIYFNNFSYISLLDEELL